MEASSVLDVDPPAPLRWEVRPPGLERSIELEAGTL
jgi:hypothetical protein